MVHNITFTGLNSDDYGMDGISLFSLLKNETQHTRDSFLIEYHGENGRNDPRCQDVIDDNLAGMN